MTICIIDSLRKDPADGAKFFAFLKKMQQANITCIVLFHKSVSSVGGSNE